MTAEILDHLFTLLEGARFVLPHPDAPIEVYTVGPETGEGDGRSMTFVDSLGRRVPGRELARLNGLSYFVRLLPREGRP